MQLQALRCAGEMLMHVTLGLIHQLGELLYPGAQSAGDLGSGGFIVVGEGGGDAAALLAGIRQHIAPDVKAP